MPRFNRLSTKSSLATVDMPSTLGILNKAVSGMFFPISIPLSIYHPRLNVVLYDRQSILLRIGMIYSYASSLLSPIKRTLFITVAGS